MCPLSVPPPSPRARPVFPNKTIRSHCCPKVTSSSQSSCTVNLNRPLQPSCPNWLAPSRDVRAMNNLSSQKSAANFLVIRRSSGVYPHRDRRRPWALRGLCDGRTGNLGRIRTGTVRRIRSERHTARFHNPSKSVERSVRSRSRPTSSNVPDFDYFTTTHGALHQPTNYTKRMLADPVVKPMPLLRRPKPFPQPDWLFELKYDGFRELAW